MPAASTNLCCTRHVWFAGQGPWTISINESSTWLASLAFSSDVTLSATLDRKSTAPATRFTERRLPACDRRKFCSSRLCPSHSNCSSLNDRSATRLPTGGMPCASASNCNATPRNRAWICWKKASCPCASKCALIPCCTCSFPPSSITTSVSTSSSKISSSSPTSPIFSRSSPTAPRPAILNWASSRRSGRDSVRERSKRSNTSSVCLEHASRRMAVAE
mmetsp:Transcript_30134/g.98495  ORF Transcript_30134/g.98495 Transcript_30134/m.98495 type:complete len:219 (-) Transcript_30134:154-810(-)